MPIPHFKRQDVCYDMRTEKESLNEVSFICAKGTAAISRMYHEQWMQVKLMWNVQTSLVFSPMPFCLPVDLSAALVFEMTFWSCQLQVPIVLQIRSHCPLSTARKLPSSINPGTLSAAHGWWVLQMCVFSYFKKELKRICYALGFPFSIQQKCSSVYGFSLPEFFAEILLWENGSAPTIPEPHPGYQQRDHVDQWLWGGGASLRLERQEHWHCQEAGGLLCKTAQLPHAFHAFLFWGGEGAWLKEIGLSSLFWSSWWFLAIFLEYFWIKNCETTL